MDIKTGTELTIQPKGLQKSFKSIFVGEKSDVYIVTDLPQELPFSREDLHKGDKVTVRYSYEGCFYEFETGIRDILKEPVELLILGYPVEIKFLENRSRKRINCLIEAKFEIILEDNNRLITGVIENISKTGCNCVIKKLKDVERPFSLGDRISLRCQFPGFAGQQTAEGKIIRFQDKADEIRAGIRFNKELWWIPPYGTDSEDNTSSK